MIDTCSCGDEHLNHNCDLLGELRPAPDFRYWGEDWPGSDSARTACKGLDYDALHEAFCAAQAGRTARASVFESEFIAAVKKLRRSAKR